jgi:hypothetical protein
VNYISGIQNFVQIREQTKSEYGVLVEPEKTGYTVARSESQWAFT